jgi:hypothetical protein
MVDGHLNISILGMHIGKELVSFTFFVTGALLDLTLAHFKETGQACDSLV